MRIRIQEQVNLPKLTNKPDLQPFKTAFVHTVVIRLLGITYIKYIFHVKIQPFVTAKSDKYPNPPGSVSAFKPMRIYNYRYVKNNGA